MKIPDANVLIYAVNEADSSHERARSWMEDALSGMETVGLAWVCLLSFLRITTNPSVFPTALSLDEALDKVEEWLASASTASVAPGPRHAEILRELMRVARAGPNLVSDAHLAALAVEHRATVVSFDRDFLRFPAVALEVPGAE